MMKFNILFIGIFLSCTPPSPIPIVVPPTKSAMVEPLEETIYTLGYMSEYDIWEFLKGKPSEKEVIETFGFPDSVWLDDEQSTKFLYYYISKIRDYNTIEVSATTDSVSGFEWD
jgi:hypothetical protein|tara:strand:+ start:283 stop:624 length:342 start_codon:yes stop_codon:yes gene_type:complete